MQHLVQRLADFVYPSALEWAHSLCIAHTFYIITILEYGHIEELAAMPMSLIISVILSSIVSTMVQVRIFLDTLVGTY
jgi:hypothetical protein